MNDVCLERKYMEKLTKQEIILATHCESVGMDTKEIALMLLVFEEKTKIAQKKIIKKILKTSDKFKMLDLLLDTK